jgi:hypothetical protein
MKKRGDLSPCGTMKFWQYRSYIDKKTGKKAEKWIPINEFDEYREAAIMKCMLSSARSDFKQMQKNK